MTRQHDDVTAARPDAEKTRSWFSRADWIITLLFLVVGTVVGTWHTEKHAGPPSFYQEYFGSGVALACGMGFVNLDAGPVPALHNFLSARSDSVACEEVRKATTSPASPWQLMHRYQMTLAGLLWRIRGAVTWSGLAPLFGLLFGATVAVSYPIARLLLHRAVAVVVGLVLLFSPLHLGILPLLRDYSKAPFFLAAILLIGIVITRRLTLRQSLIIAAVAGAVVGFGFGFRADVLVCLPPVIVTLLVFVSGRLRDTWLQRLASTAVFLIAFVLVALPPLRGMTQQGANAHVTLLGFAELFDVPLGLETPYYQWAYQYNDTHIASLLNAYLHWTTGDTRPMPVISQPYERLGREYIRAIVTNFPADMLTRGYAAVMRVLELPGNGLANKLHLDVNQQPIGIRPPELLGRYLSVQRFVQRLTAGGDAFVLFAIASLVIIAARSVRVAICATLVVLYFGAYTLLQFSLRHTFHLEIFGWLALAFVLQSLVVAAVAWFRGDRELDAALDWKGALVIGLLLVVVPPATLFAARSYQDAHVSQLVTSYLAAPREPVSYTVTEGSAADRVLLRLNQPAPPAERMRLDYLVVEVRNGLPAGVLLFRNRPIAAPSWDQVRTVSVPFPPAMNDTYPSDITRYFFPAYSGPETLFEGVELRRDAASQVAGIYRIKRTPELPLLLWMTLQSDWRDRPQHQRLLGAEMRRTIRSYHDAEPQKEEAPPVDGRAIREVNNTTQAVDEGLRVHGMIDTTNGTYVTFEPRTMKRGATFLVEGTIDYGCVMPIVTSANIFLSAEVMQPGPFRVELTVPADGAYVSLLANTNCTGPNDLTITRAGWVP